MQTIFDSDWIKNNTSNQKTVTFLFEVDRCPYGEECEVQTIFYDQNEKMFVASDDHGGTVSLKTWDEFLDMLKSYGVTRLMESSINDPQLGFHLIDSRNAFQHCSLCKVKDYTPTKEKYQINDIFL